MLKTLFNSVLNRDYTPFPRPREAPAISDLGQGDRRRQDPLQAGSYRRRQESGLENRRYVCYFTDLYTTVFTNPHSALKAFAGLGLHDDHTSRTSVQLEEGYRSQPQTMRTRHARHMRSRPSRSRTWRVLRHFVGLLHLTFSQICILGTRTEARIMQQLSTSVIL